MANFFEQMGKSSPWGRGTKSGEQRSSEEAAASKAEADARIRREQEEALRRERDKRLTELTETETKARGQLGIRTAQAGIAIDQELAQVTKSLGYQADQGRQETAAVISDRGLLRSSIGNDAIGSVTQQELTAKNQATIEASTRKKAVSFATQKTLDSIVMQRQQLADKIRESSMEQLQSINEAFTLTKIQSQMESEMFNIEQDAAKRAAILGAVGGMAGSLATMGFLI